LAIGTYPFPFVANNCQFVRFKLHNCTGICDVDGLLMLKAV